jgi:HEAT repeat protein
MSLVGIGTAIAPWLGEWATVAVAGAIIKGLQSQFDSSKIQQVLQEAILKAEREQPTTGGLFFKCHSDGPKGFKKFLEQFFQSGEVLEQLQKPLQSDCKPSLDILVLAFEQSAKDHPEVKNHLPDLLRPWMEKFVESYFEQIKGICFQVAKTQYLKQLARRVDDVKFVGIAVPGEEVEKQEVLAQIFVMPDLREEKKWTQKVSDPHEIRVFESFYEKHKSSPLDNDLKQQYKELINSGQQNNLIDEQRQWAMRDRSAPRISAQKVINLAQKKAVILGAPGSGKTMLASYFALMLCETPQSDPTQIGLKAEDDYLPVVVRIRDWILESKMGLLEYLRSNAEANLSCKKLPTGFFEHWLERGRTMILLDGLDEVVDEAQRRKVAEQIETFLHQYQDNPAVITSRPAGYRWDFFNLDEFPHYTLESFDDKQVTTFIDHWYDSRLKDDPAQAERRKADLQKAFARNERIKSLARNPLLLTIITLIHRYQAELPRQRCKLYEKAVETLLTSWDSGKEIKLYSQVLLFLKPDDLLHVLKKLAYWIHTQGSMGETEGGTLIDKDELIRWLRREIQTLKKCEAHEAKGEAERFIDFIQRRTGLLNEQGRDRYAFVHKTFQEYLTAEEIFDRADVADDTEIILDHFRQYLHDQHWREVLLLLVSKLKGKKAQKAIQAVLDTGSEYEQWLHRDLLFAGWCLTEDPPELSVVAANWVGDILDRLVALEVGDSEQIGGKIKSAAAKILRCFGETTVEQDVWAKLQAQGDRIDRFRLLAFQAALGQETAAIATLLSLLSDQKSNVRSSTVRALGQLGNSSPEVVSALLSLLSDQKSNVRSSTVRALGQLGNSSPEVVSALLSLLIDQDSDVRSSAVQALVQLGNSSPEIVSALLSLLSHQESDVRYSAVQILGHLGNSSPEVVSALLSLLIDQDSNVRSSAAHALGQLGNSSPEVVSALLSLLIHQESDVRFSAADALGQLGNSSPEIVSALLSLLSHQESDVRYSAAQALGQLGNSSPEVVIALLSLLIDQDSNVRSSAAEALGKLGNSSPEVVSALLSLLIDQEWMVHSSAARALGQLGNSSPEVVSALLSFLSDQKLTVHSSAVQALVQLGNSSPEVVSALLSFLSDQKWTVHSCAAQALGKLGNSSPEVVSALLSLLGGQRTMRSSAARALGQLAKTSDIIRRRVLQWLEQNPNNDVIGNAIDCLWSIVVE